MNSDATKVSPNHLDRDAYLYVRQSTLRQVLENTESTQRQYALRERAIALGWPIERVQVIDCDQGQSGASAADREGFQRLVAEVSLGHAGIVLGLEVSRLARNNSDWHRLLEICALTGTLILDEDGLYDPSQFNDRLLLGLKGTISEAELYVLRARLRGGILEQGGRGELKTPLPVGLVYDPQDRVVLDPDREVQDVLRALFTTYERTGSGLRDRQILPGAGLVVPATIAWRGLRKGSWSGDARPFAGAASAPQPAVRRRFLPWPNSLVSEPQWRQDLSATAARRVVSLLPETHAGYITWEQYQRNQRGLRKTQLAAGCRPAQEPAGRRPGTAARNGALW